MGAVSQQCDKNGQCDCRDNVVGRRCDSCHDGTAALDEMGCRGNDVALGWLEITIILPVFLLHFIKITVYYTNVGNQGGAYVSGEQKKGEESQCVPPYTYSS